MRARQLGPGHARPRQAEPAAHPPPARPARRLHGPAGDVRPAVRLRVRRRDPDAGLDYVDFLMPGIIVQSMAFGGFVTALGLAEDLKKGLIDRFRSLPMSRSAVLTGRTLADIVSNVVQLVVMIGVGLAVGFSFATGVAGDPRRRRAAAPDRLRVLVGLRRHRARRLVAGGGERVRVHDPLPADVRLLGVRPGRLDAVLARRRSPRSTRSRRWSTRFARCSSARLPERRLGRGAVVDRIIAVFAPLPSGATAGRSGAEALRARTRRSSARRAL